MNRQIKAGKGMVRLLAPISSFEAAVRVVSAGADELYCGVRIPKMRYEGLSLRPPRCSLSSYKDLRRVVRYAQDRDVKTVVTAEFPFISDVVEKGIQKHVRSCVDAGIDALILGDLGLLLLVKEMNVGIPIYASTYFASMNVAAVAFLRQLGAERIILERNVTIEEIHEIVQRSRDGEIEVFIHGPGCSNINVNCYGCFIPDTLAEPLARGQIDIETVRPYLQHVAPNKVRITAAPMCKLLFRIFDVTRGEQKEITFTNMLDAYTFCSFCALPALVKTGVTGFKIVGREMSLAYQEAVTRTYRELLDLIEQGQIEEFQKTVSAQRSEARGVWFEGLPQSPCDQQRCYYSPIFHAPYKIDAPQRSTPY